jgi:hypothetical protein
MPKRSMSGNLHSNMVFSESLKMIGFVLNHLRQAIAIGTDQAEQGDFSPRSVQDVIAQSNQSA